MDRPRRVYILGAGFSKASGFPLAAELTDELLIEFRARTGDEHELLKLVSGIKDLVRYLNAGGGDSRLNIEELFELATSWMEWLFALQHLEPVGRDAGDTAHAAGQNIRTWLGYMEDDLLTVLQSHERRADLAKIDGFARSLSDSDTVLTFNYDCLVERALASHKIQPDLGLMPKTQGGIRVLKLHGSLDWVQIRRDNRLKKSFLEPLFSKRDANQEFRQVSEGESLLTGEGEFDYELARITDTQALDEFIRNRNIHGFAWRRGWAGLGPYKRISSVPGLGVVWGHALESLRTAEEIVIVGFSFSNFDRFAQFQFARAMDNRARAGIAPPRIAVIDPGVALGPRCDLLMRVGKVFRPVEVARAVGQEDVQDWSDLFSSI